MTPRTLPAGPQRAPFALALTAMLVVLTASSAIQAAPTVDELIAKGQSLMAEGKAKKAAKQFRRAVEASEGESLDALLGLAQASLRAGESRDAVEASQQVLATTRDPAARLTAYQVLGSGHYDLAIRDREFPSRDTLDAAAEAYREAQALGRERGIHTPSYSLALVLSELDDPAGARDLLRQFPFEQLAPAVATQARQLLCQVKRRLPTEPLAREPVDWEEEGLWQPRRVSSLPPPFPTTPGGRLVQGVFKFQIVYDTEGCAHEVELVEHPPVGPNQDPAEAFNLDPTIEALRSQVYEPALLNGEPVPFRGKFNFDTEIQ